MLNRLRRRSAFAAVLIAAVFGTIGAPHSTDPRHDSDRAIVVVPHNHADHQLRSPGADSDSTDTHCVLCHFARTFRPRGDVRAVSAPPTRGTAHHPAEVFVAYSTDRVTQPPLRAPPASPSFA
jgi:hypothetical protein